MTEPRDIANAQKMLALFGPRDDVYGIAKGDVRREPITTALVAEHLAGSSFADLGFFPLRDDGTVRFAAVDLDEPDFQLATEIAEMIPGNAWIERSRSGNAHVWVFFSDDCPAWVARGQLRKILELMDLPRVEIFPKQGELLPGMVGNYISAPYFGGERPMIWQSNDGRAFCDMCNQRYAVEGFLHDAMETRIDPEHWHNLCIIDGIEPPASRADGGEEWGTRSTPHMCATYMLENKFDNPLVPGHRATVLFNLAKQLANVEGFDEETVINAVEGMNEAGTDPISRREVHRFVANAFRGKWVSTGCDDPVMSPYVHPDCPIAKRR